MATEKGRVILKMEASPTIHINASVISYLHNNLLSVGDTVRKKGLLLFTAEGDYRFQEHFHHSELATQSCKM